MLFVRYGMLYTYNISSTTVKKISYLDTSNKIKKTTGNIVKFSAERGAKNRP